VVVKNIPFLSFSLSTLLAQPPSDLQLFLLTGQSNMAGRGVVEAQDKEPIPRVYVLTKDLEWKPAVDPLHFDKPDIVGVGLARSFARELAKANPPASIGLIPSAFGGTSLEEWKPGGKLYNDAVTRARAAMKSGKLRGILWHQGEADSGKEEDARSYRERWTKVIGSLREDLNAANVPVMVGQLGEFYAGAFARTVDEQLAIIPLQVPKTAFVSSAGLKAKSDNVHFDSPSLREFGRRYAHAFLMLDPGWVKK
jgi:Carbohydrate esterase, sialic acid-specific acetylesterase